jgi:hypothetical protein
MSTTPSQDEKACQIALDKVEFILDVAPLAVGVDQMEPLFEDFLEYVLARPRCAPVLAVRYEALLDELPEGSDDLVQFTMHELRWPEIWAYTEKCLSETEDVTRRTRYRDILAAFDDDWPARDLYLRYDPTRDG